MKLLSLCYVTLLTLQLGAQFPNEPRSEATGKLFTLQFSPKDKKAKFYIAGKQAAKIDFNKSKDRFEITAKQGEKSQKLEFTQMGDAYEVTELPKWQGPFEIHLKGKVDKETETLKIDIP